MFKKINVRTFALKISLLLFFCMIFSNAELKAEVVSVAIPWNCPQSESLAHPISSQKLIRISYDKATKTWNDSNDLKELQSLFNHSQTDYTECLGEFNSRLKKYYSAPNLGFSTMNSFSADYEKKVGEAFRRPPLIAGEKHQEFYPSNKLFYAAYATEMLFYCTGEENNLYGNPKFERREFQSPVLQAHLNNYNFELSSNLWEKKDHLERIEKFLPLDCKMKYLEHIKESARRQKSNCSTEECARQVERFVFKVIDRFAQMGSNMAPHLDKYREKMLCENQKGNSANEMKEINDLISKNLSSCIKLNDGESVLTSSEPYVINDPNNVNMEWTPPKYQLTKIPSKDPREEHYQIGLNFRFNHSFKKLLQSILNDETSNPLEINKKMRNKLQSCFGGANKKLTVDLPNGKKGKFSFKLMEENFSPLQAVEIAGASDGTGRDNILVWSEDIDCPTMMHEVFHWVGLKDEYHTSVDQYVKNKDTGNWEKKDVHQRAPLNKLIFNLTNKSIPAFNCRSQSSEDSIMFNQHLAFKKESILYPGHFRSIVSRGCPYMNETFRKCTEKAYTTTVGNCIIAPECQDPKLWLEK